jgi:hypothetical protein
MSPALRSLPISPYPVPAGTHIRAHFVSETRPKEDGWQPWIGGTWSKWVQGTVLGYRDFAGREAMVSRWFRVMAQLLLRCHAQTAWNL